MGLRSVSRLRGAHVLIALASGATACSSGSALDRLPAGSESSQSEPSESTSSATSAGSTSAASSGSSIATTSSASGSTSASGSGSSTADSCAAAVSTQTGGAQYCANSQGNVGSTGYSFTLWSNGTGTGCMTVFGDATFKANWSAAGDFLSRVGLGFNSTKTPDQIGTLAADFAETKSGTAAYSNIGIYGWSTNPLHEYYIVDDWFGSRPVPGSKMGTITVDGGMYDVYTHTQTNQPAITGGNATFVQFLSVRQSPRSCGHISISEHFSQWATLGMQLGNLEEAKILMEAGGNATGSIDFTTASVTLD